MDRGQLGEAALQRVLDQVLCIPRISGQSSAVAEEVRAKGIDEEKEIEPGRGHGTTRLIGEPDLVVRHGVLLAGLY
jgi:hypothetical protein